MIVKRIMKTAAGLLVLCAGVYSMPAAVWAEPDRARPASWAQRVERPGLDNLHRVSEVLWRGAQPTAEGIMELHRLGVKTIVNLRHDSDHDDRPLMEEAGVWSKMGYERIHFSPFRPRVSQVVEFLEIVVDPDRQPVFVHCKHGADRTGMMVALYRIVVQNWSRQDALQEMTEGGFQFHSVWQNLLRFVRRADIESLRTAVLQKTPKLRRNRT